MHPGGACQVYNQSLSSQHLAQAAHLCYAVASCDWPLRRAFDMPLRVLRQRSLSPSVTVFSIDLHAEDDPCATRLTDVEILGH